MERTREQSDKQKSDRYRDDTQIWSSFGQDGSQSSSTAFGQSMEDPFLFAKVPIPEIQKVEAIKKSLLTSETDTTREMDSISDQRTNSWGRTLAKAPPIDDLPTRSSTHAASQLQTTDQIKEKLELSGWKAAYATKSEPEVYKQEVKENEQQMDEQIPCAVASGSGQCQQQSRQEEEENYRHYDYYDYEDEDETTYNEFVDYDDNVAPFQELNAFGGFFGMGAIAAENFEAAMHAEVLGLNEGNDDLMDAQEEPQAEQGLDYQPTKRSHG